MTINLPRMLGVSGRAYSGKDSFARIAVRRLSLITKQTWVRAGFSNNLKECCERIFGFSAEQLHGALKGEVDPRWGITPRQAMQHLGKSMRELYPNIWLEGPRSPIWRQRVIIADCRFPSEADAIRNQGGLVIKITGRNVELEESAKGDDTEAHLDEVQADFEIVNDGTLAEYEEMCGQVIDQILERK